MWVFRSVLVKHRLKLCAAVVIWECSERFKKYKMKCKLTKDTKRIYSHRESCFHHNNFFECQYFRGIELFTRGFFNRFYRKLYADESSDLMWNSNKHQCLKNIFFLSFWHSMFNFYLYLNSACFRMHWMHSAHEWVHSRNVFRRKWIVCDIVVIHFKMNTNKQKTNQKKIRFLKVASWNRVSVEIHLRFLLVL